MGGGLVMVQHIETCLSDLSSIQQKVVDEILEVTRIRQIRERERAAFLGKHQLLMIDEAAAYFPSPVYAAEYIASFEGWETKHAKE